MVLDLSPPASRIRILDPSARSLLGGTSRIRPLITSVFRNLDSCGTKNLYDFLEALYSFEQRISKGMVHEQTDRLRWYTMQHFHPQNWYVTTLIWIGRCARLSREGYILGKSVGCSWW